MQAAVLYNRDRRFAGLVLDALRAEPGLSIGDNEPYFVSDDTDYSVPRHGRGARAAACGNRDPPGLDRRCGGTGGMGAASGQRAGNRPNRYLREKINDPAG